MRYITQNILTDLQSKMVFVSGPRQCGKTTMIKSLLPEDTGLYLNWDNHEHRKIILKSDWDQNNELICFDEIHKYSRWKNLVKGIYDTKKESHKFIITGSVKLDIYKKGQDSMLGRFFS